MRLDSTEPLAPSPSTNITGIFIKHRASGHTRDWGQLRGDERGGGDRGGGEGGGGEMGGGGTEVALSTG